jgi:hypothetical protein
MRTAVAPRPNRGGDPLDRPVPDVAGREHQAIVRAPGQMLK